MAKLGTAYVDVIGNFAPLNKAITTNKSRITQRMAAIGKAGALAGAALGIAAVKSSIDFQHSMTLVQTQAGASRKEVDKLSESILNFAGSGKTEFGPKELADALFRVSSAGIHGAKAMETLKQASNLATIGQADLEETTKSLVAAQKTGIKGSENLKKAIGTLNATVGSGQLKLEDLVSAMGTGLLGPARAVGLTLTDVGGALAELTKQGQPAAASATRLRMTFLKMAAPTDSAKEALKGIGLNAMDLATDMRQPDGLMVALEDLNNHMKDLSKNERVDLLTKAFGGAKSGSTIMTLLLNLGDLDSTLQHIKDHAGEVDKALARAREDPAVRLQEAYAQLQSILVRLGSKAVPVVVDGLSEIAKIITDPKITADEKFSRITKIITNAFTDAVPKVGVAAVKIGAEAVKGIFNGFIHSNLLGKLFIGGALIRILGGKGAITAAGVGIGKWLGIGVSTGMAEGVAGAGAAGGLAAGAAGGAGARTITGQIIGSEAGVAAAGAGAGGTFGGSFLTKAGSVLKNVKWARVAGLGIGIALADATLNEFQRRADEKSGDIFKEISAKSGNRNILGLNVDFSGEKGLLNQLTGWNPLADKSEQTARDLKDRLDEVSKSQHSVSEQTRKSILAMADSIGVTDEARAGLEKFLATGHGFKDWRAQLRAVSSDKEILKIQDGFDFLRSSIPSSMKDIARVVKSNVDVINKNLGGEKTKQGRKALAENFRLAAKSAARMMQRTGHVTKDGLAHVENLIRHANILDPTRKIARDFGREWAKGMIKGGKITKDGVDTVLGHLKDLDKGSRDIAIRGLLDRLKVMVREKDISKKTYKDIKSNVLSTFTDSQAGARKKSAGLVNDVLDNVFSLSTGLFSGFTYINKTASKSLLAFGAKALKYSIDHPQKPKGAARRQTGGGVSSFDVPDRGPMGDRHHIPLLLERGERGFILNRHAAGVQRKLETLNKKFPRFGATKMARGGAIPGDSAGLQPAIAGLVRKMIASFGGSIASGLRPGDSGSFHSQGIAADYVPNDWAGAARYANRIGPQLLEGIYTGAHGGPKVSWDTGQRVPPSFWGGDWAPHSTHIHLAVRNAVSGAIGAAFKKIGRVILKGPDGPPKEGGQAVLDKVRDAANSFLAKKAPSMTGDLATGSWKGINTPGEFIPYWRQSNPDVKQFAKAFSIIVGRESTWNPKAINHIGLGHAGWYQFDPPTWNQFKPKGATSSWPSGPFDPGAATLAAGNVARREGWGGVMSRWASTYGGRMLGGLVDPIVQRLAGGGETHPRRWWRHHFKGFRGWARHHGLHSHMGTGEWFTVLRQFAEAKGINPENMTRLHGNAVGDPEQWRNRWDALGRKQGGVIEPILGSLRDGGLIGKDGAYILHAGEVVIPGMKQGGQIDIPKGTLRGLVGLLRRLRGHSDAFEVKFSEKNQKLLAKLLKKQEEGKLTKAEKKQLSDLKKDREKARREAKKERRQFAHLMQRAINANGTKQVNAIRSALNKVGVDFTKHDAKKLRQLVHEQRHHGLTDEQRQRLKAVAKAEEKLKREARQHGGLTAAEQQKLKNLRDRERRLEAHRGGLTAEQHRELRELKRDRKLDHQEKLAREALTVQEKLIESNKALQTDLKEHNQLARTARANRRDALEAVTNLAAHQIGARGLQKRRNAGWGEQWRY